MRTTLRSPTRSTAPTSRKATAATAAVLLVLAALAWPGGASAANLERKFDTARQVWDELFAVPDRAVPQGLLDRSRCIAVIPRIYKGAFGIGGRHGRGVLTCRDLEGAWSPPIFVELSGGSIGFQVGFEATDLVLFFLTEGSVLSLLESKITLGGDASVAAGPAGRAASATTDLKLRAEIYAYAKAKGLFAGVSVEGARLAPDRGANYKYYGRWVPPKAILFEGHITEVPPEARAFLDALP